MGTSYQVLAQGNPSATTSTTLYTVPALTQAIISTIVVCNQGVSTNFNIQVSIGGVAANAAQYIAYQDTVNQNDSSILTMGITMNAGDILYIYAGTANLSFNAFGCQIT